MTARFSDGLPIKVVCADLVAGMLQALYMQES